MEHLHEEHLKEEKETGRIEAFSDGVFAIAITLLIIDIKVPHESDLHAFGGKLLPALLNLWPAYIGFVISFCTILIIWANHHRLFNYICRSDDRFLFSNGSLLFLVTFIPFPTAVLAEYIRTPQANVAAALYSGTFFLVALVFNLLWRHASKKCRLLDRSVDTCTADAISKQFRVRPPLYFLAFLFSFFSVPLCIIMCFGLAVFFAMTGKITRLTCSIKKPRS
jgi:uncharacterized membrane protein